LAGRLDVGDVEVERLRARLVLRDGKLQNVRYHLPGSGKKSGPLEESPFSSLSVTDARAELDIDGVRIDTGSLDLDVFGEKGPTFEVMLSASGGGLSRTRGIPPSKKSPEGTIASDEDVFCRVELRARLSTRALLVRRLSALAVADLDPARATQPSCDVSEDAVGRVALRLSQLRLELREGEAPYVGGHVVSRAPLALLTRFVGGPALTGWAGFSGDVRYDRRYTLPELEGRVSGAGLGIEQYRIANYLNLEATIAADVLRIPRLELGFSDGHVVAENSRLAPLAQGFPMSVERFEAKGILFETMMRDLDVTPDTIIRWNLATTRVNKLQGTLNPVSIDGELSGENKDFEVFDRAFHDRARRHVIGVKNATLRGKIGVRPNALLIYDTRTDFGESSMFVKLVSIGFDNQIKLQVAPGSKLNLADITPLIDIPMSGHAELDVTMAGLMSDPLLTGNLKIAGFEFGGFPLGDIKSSKVKFRPLWLELAELEGRKGQSDFRVPRGKLDFGAGPTLIVEADAQSDALDLRDFFDMWHFDEDPRFEPLQGRTAVDARIRYVLGGREDRCLGGVLHTSGKLRAHALSLFDERYDGGSASFDFLWNDRDATYRGVRVDVPDFVLRKGRGTLSGKVQVSPGARVKGEISASGVPIGKVDALPAMLRAAEGNVTASGLISGTIDALEAEVSANMSALRTGGSTLPPSSFQVRLVPIVRPEKLIGTTRCGQPISAAFDRAEYDRDLAAGVFHVDGSLLGDQLALQDLKITRQRQKVVAGRIALTNLDLGALSELSPELALTKPRVNGRVSGAIQLEELAMEQPALARGTVDLTRLELDRAGFRAELLSKTAPIRFDRRTVAVPSTTVALTSSKNQRATFDMSAAIDAAGAMDATLSLHPVPLAGLVDVLPRVERAAGTLNGKLRLRGPVKSPRATGGFEIDRGELTLRGFPTPLRDIALAVGIDGNELSITRGSMRVGNGTVVLSGGAPLSGFALGEARVRVGAREIALPLKDGIRAVADAELLATYRPPSDADSERRLPRVTGNVVLRTAEYRRAVTMAADLNALAQRGKRTVFDSYDPSEDVLEFDLNIKAQRALKLHNDLVEADLVLDDEGLQLAGTNARNGVRGVVRVKPGGRIVLRRSEFEITEGTIRFDDLTRIAPQVDVTAVTEYRRYSDAPVSGAGSSGSQAAGNTGSTSAAGGRWNIRLHAYGDADNLRVDLTSDPALPQDDIFLLLTVGLTRAELDQARSASVGESVALEALGTLTGADRAVKDALPLIDEFRFGSAYSSRTGRTEPTVTVGKRLTERVRANVTSGLSETREIRSNLEWRLSPRVSVEGSYDNVNDIGSSSLGNLGADIRWRLEFE
jgi:translocation and assembly module TamB